MPIKHAFPSGKADPVDITLVKPSNWNADHDYPAFTIFGIQFGDDPYNTITLPAALSEPYGADSRTKYDLTRCATARVCSNTFTNASNLDIDLAVQYSADQVTWNFLDHVDGPYSTLNPTGVVAGAWVNLNAAAKNDVFLRWVTRGGDGVHSIQMHQHYLQVR